MTSESQSSRIQIVLLALVLAVGVFLRIPSQTFAPGAPLRGLAPLHPDAAFKQVGFDENLYAEYLGALIKNGISSYPDMAEAYIARQQSLPHAILPPVRFFYIFAAYLWHGVFGSEPFSALRWTSALFSALGLGLATMFAWRLRGSTFALGIAALMAVAPTQIHMSQHALIDGVFAFWALLCLWLLWENLRRPGDWRWLLAYGLALAGLVVTKENSCFAWVALVVLIITNRWLRFGIVTRELLLATIAGPLLGVVFLVFIAGGLSNLIAIYQLLVVKASQTQYAILTGDGPWHRYLVDLLLVSPIVLILAVGGLFRLNRTMKPELYLSMFIAASYLMMCNVKYGMNLRYTNMWDMPLRFLALSALVSITAALPRYRSLVLGVCVGLICAAELRQYIILAVQFPLYELVSEGLLRALRILKSH
jgi:4-amino-4-deoxy-L-arabinose transferase-like glycosyltransferase